MFPGLSYLFILAVLLLYYGITGLAFYFCLRWAWKARWYIKPLPAAACLIVAYLFYYPVIHFDEIDKGYNRDTVGTYRLTAWPDCDTCYAVLTEDLSYVVIDSQQRVRRRGTWRTAVGPDFWIVYLDGERHQLGNGDFRYDESWRKYDKRLISSPPQGLK